MLDWKASGISYSQQKIRFLDEIIFQKHTETLLKDAWKSPQNKNVWMHLLSRNDAQVELPEIGFSPGIS